MQFFLYLTYEFVLLLFSCCCGVNTILAILFLFLRAARDVLILSFLLSRFFRGPPGPNCQRCSLAGGMSRLMHLFKSIWSFGVSFACPVTSSFSKRKSRNSVLTPYPKGQGLFLRCEYRYLFLSFTLTKAIIITLPKTAYDSFFSYTPLNPSHSDPIRARVDVQG